MCALEVLEKLFVCSTLGGLIQDVYSSVREVRERLALVAMGVDLVRMIFQEIEGLV